MMTRVVADISLIQRLIAMGTILVIILAYATLVGFSFMLYFSPALTLLLLPPMPFIYHHAKRLSRQMGSASMDVQNRLSELAAQTQENLVGIRTIQAMAQEENEIARFAATNEGYAGAFHGQARINSLMAAWMPTLAAACSVTILGYGGHLVLSGELTPGAPPSSSPTGCRPFRKQIGCWSSTKGASPNSAPTRSCWPAAASTSACTHCSSKRSTVEEIGWRVLITYHVSHIFFATTYTQGI